MNHTQPIAITDDHHPQRDTPEVEYLARLAYSREDSPPPWHRLSERERAGIREGVCAVLDILRHVSGADREAIADEWRKLIEWVRTDAAKAVLERHEAGG